MAESGPTLSELANLPARATGQPATVIDNSQMVAVLNQNARFKAENDWRKYQQFLENLGEVSKNANMIAGLEVMPQDRDYLDRQRGKIFNSILKNPRSLAGGPEFIKLKGDIAQYMSEATQSKQDYAFDWAHRQLLNQNPEWSTDENKKTIDDFTRVPLGSRRQYTLNMPAIVDMGKLLEGVFKDPTVTQTIPTFKLSPDGRWMQQESTTRIRHDPFMNRWNAALDFQVDKYGHPLKTYAKQLYDQMPDRMKKSYLKQDGTPDLDKVWNDMGEKLLGSQEDIITKQTGKVGPNPFALQQQKFRDDLAKMGQKFQYDVFIKKLGENEKEAFRLFEQRHPLSPNAQGAGINDLTVAHLVDAQTRGKNVWVVDDNGKQTVEKLAPWSPSFKQMFSETKTDYDLYGRPKTTKVEADMITVDADGNTRVVFWEKDKEGKPIMNPRTGKPKIDRGLSKVVSPDDLKTRIANTNKLTGALNNSIEDLKDLLGAPTLDGNIENYYQLRFENQKPAAEETPKTGTEKKPKESTTKIITATRKEFKDRNWTDEQIQKALDAGKIKLSD